MRQKRITLGSILLFAVLIAYALFVIIPIIVVAYNSFKGNLYITASPFSLPSEESFSGLANYELGLHRTKFFTAFFYTVWITVASVGCIVVLNSMLAYYITRVSNCISKLIYLMLVFSMVVPFQMVMYPMSKFANMIHLDNLLGIVVLYIGFGTGLSTFMFSGFIKGIPVSMDEAAFIDGATTRTTFFRVIFPMLKSISITIAILNTMWIWNDYLLPYLTIGTEYRTIQVAIQYLRGGYGFVDMGAMMAMLVLAMIPVIIFYLTCQKYIIQGVLAGAIKE